MGRKWKIVAAAAIAILIAIQFVRPERSNPPSDPTLAITAQKDLPAGVRAVMERSCYDCHSNQTRWPWYSGVAPVSWFVAEDVQEGRKHLNFSEWGTYTLKRQIAKLEMIASEVDKGEMPMERYLWLHRDAVLSEADKDLLTGWAGNLSDSLAGKEQ